MGLEAMMAEIAAAFMDPLRGALGGVAGVALPLLNSAMVLIIGLNLMTAAFGAQMPTGSLIHSFLTIGIAQAAINFWPRVIDSTIEQIDVLGGLAGTPTTDPFEVLTAGAALSTLAFDHAGGAVGYFSGWIIGALLGIAGLVIFCAYLIISALSLAAWVQYWAAAVILAPLVALMPVVGFNQAGFVPFSFLVSATMRIVAIALIATYGTDLMDTYALPGLEEEITWLHAFIAVGLAGVLLALAWVANSMIGGILEGRPGFAGGVAAVKSAIAGAASQVGGAMSRTGTAAGGAARSGGGGGGGSTGSTAAPVNSRTKGP